MSLIAPHSGGHPFRGGDSSISNARPCILPPDTIACQENQPAPTASLQARTARPTAAARQASGRTKGEPRAPGGGRRGDGLAGAEQR